jgi:Dimerisation domain
MNEQFDPSHIMQTATAFWASKVLLTAVELELFPTLSDGALSASQLGEKLGLHYQPHWPNQRRDCI